MAKWILSRPADKCHVAELQVAEYLSELSDDWVIRWGFYYEDNRRTTREGDFLVLGPHGGLMVLEVKSGDLNPNRGTGRWGTASGDNPMAQLDAEAGAVVDTVNEHRADRPSLFVFKAIALPATNFHTELKDYHGIPRKHIIGKNELQDFGQTWANRFAPHKRFLDGRSRQIFFDTYGRDVSPKVVKHFMDESDRILARQTESKSLLLDQLSANRQFCVRGGPGSGKTWLAFELARRWAESGEHGARVLYICYNLALTDCMKRLAENAVRRGKIEKGEIVVKGWEELAKEIFAKAELPFEIPEEPSKIEEFYTETVPELLVEAARQANWAAEFDALVVDEGQDHDTALRNEPEDFSGPGWWGIYFRMLKEGNRARIGVFYDSAQRPEFRSSQHFDIEQLHRSLGDNPVWVNLPRTVRYPRPVFEYLKSLETPALKSLTDTLQQYGRLPEGPEVESYRETAAATPDRVSEIARSWIDSNLCRPDEILILSCRGSRKRSSLAEVEKIAGRQLVEYLDRRPGCISFTSANKAKGLDSRAVILIDFKPFEEIEDAGFQVAFFIGASRARQLLAIVSKVE